MNKGARIAGAGMSGALAAIVTVMGGLPVAQTIARFLEVPYEGILILLTVGAGVGFSAIVYMAHAFSVSASQGRQDEAVTDAR